MLTGLSSQLVHQYRRFIVWGALGAAALLVVACSSEPSEAPPATGSTGAANAATEAEPTFVTATLTEFAIELTASTAPTGSVVFQALNSGAIPHEFVIVRSDLDSGALPVKDGSVDLGALDTLGEIAEVVATNTESIRLEMATGRYVLICDLPGHYAAGMHTTFVVE